MKSKTKLLGLIVISTVALMLYISGAHGQEDGVDRRGSDLKPGYNLPAADPALCKKDCDADPNCQAYTYVKPGFQGPQPRCWLKSAVPAAVKNDCCVSGVNWAMLTPTATPVGCIDPSKPPPGIVFGLKHSTNQRDKWLAWGGAAYDPATAEIPPAMFTRQNGGDLDGSEGEGYYWYETTGIGFRFQVHSPSNDEAENKRWRAFASQLPEGLVFGLKHSKNQPHKFLLWLDLPREFIPWQPGSYDPAQGWSDESKHFGPWPFVQENGGDIDGSKGEGYYWYEVSQDAVQTTRPCDALLPGGLVFGLKHSINQPNKKFTWHGEVYDAAQRGGPRPPGFARCHGGDLGAP